jgi:hypothetical protein
LAKPVYLQTNGFTQKTPQGKNQSSQAAQEAALKSSQETHLAGVIAGAFLTLSFAVNALSGPEHPIEDARFPRRQARRFSCWPGRKAGDIQNIEMELRFEKHYTRDEARALLPQIRQWLAGLNRLRKDVEKYEQRLSQMSAQSDDIGGETVNDWIRALADMQQLLGEFQRREIFVKDLDRGLIDFPAIIEGREVFLCWESDEDDVEFWHDLESGFAGRERL